MNEKIWNEEKESAKSIEWVLEKAKDLFRDNKKLILGNSMLCPARQLQALTMTVVLPSYVELTNTLASMAMVFQFCNKPIEHKECERLIAYLVLYRKEGKEGKK